MFIDLGLVLMASLASKAGSRGTKIDADMKSKFNFWLKASWNAIFSAKRPQDAKTAQPKARPGGMRRSPGED